MKKKDKLVRSGNPFTPMTGIEPSVFGGRTAEINFFEQRLERALRGNYSEHFLVLGDWGICKSTLLKEFKKMCRSRGYIASLVQLEPFQEGSRLMDVARSMVEGVLRDLPFSVDKFKRISGFFDTIGIDVLGTGVQLGRDTARKDLSPQSFLYDSLRNLWEDVKGKSDVLVILLDDLDNYAPVSEIVMTIKQTLSLDRLRASRILVGISSTQANWSEMTSLKKHHPLSRYFLSRIELTPLKEPELHQTVVRSLAGTGVTFSEEVISRVFGLTKGHPFEMQVLCYHLFNNQLSRRVGMDLWEKALESSVNDLGAAVFEHWYGEASPEEAKVLRAVAEADAEVSVGETQQLLVRLDTRISSKSITKYLQRLTGKQLIERAARGRYAISDPMFRAYLRRKSSSRK